MKVQPDRSYKSPNYPTNDIVKQEPAWLRSNIPASWKGKEHIAQMLSVLLFGGTMMPNDYIIGDLKLPKEVVVRIDSLKIKAVKDDKQAAVSVAPIFEHGGGRGATGCVVIAPPVFLSEADARQVIEEELSRIKINFTEHDKPIKEITLEQQQLNITYGPKGIVKSEVEEKNDTTFVLDGYDPLHNIGYEFVSSYDQYKYVRGGALSTVFSYHPRDVADSLRQKIENFGGINVGVFYDPLPSFEMNEERFKNIKETRVKDQLFAQDLLRLQVRDFIEWAQTNNLINKAK